MTLRMVGKQKVMAAVTVDGTTKYTDVLNFEKCNGNVGVWIVSTAGTIAVSQQCSIDYDRNNPSAANWYDPVNASGSALGSVVSAQGVTTGKYISYSPVLTPWVRWKVIESTAATVVTITVDFQEEV